MNTEVDHVPGAAAHAWLRRHERSRHQGAAVIEARGLSKRYGSILAVDDLGFDVRPGAVTGFLGPNGSGKPSTTRLITSLDRPDRGTVRIHGRAYDAHAVKPQIDTAPHP